MNIFNFFKKKEAIVEAKLNADGSVYKVPLTSILKVEAHPDAHSLDICTVYGFQVVTQKGKYKVGDLAVYIPIDSILDSQLEEQLFPKDSKITLHKSRVRQIRIRKALSQGMLIHPSEFGGLLDIFDPEEDLSEVLNITKYEPPQRQGEAREPRLRNRPLENPHFRKYNGVTNIKWTPTRFENEEVVIQEKIHGSHIRFGKPPYAANTFFKKLKKLFMLAPKYEFSYGSNNVELTNRKGYVGFYGEDIYGACLAKNNAVDKVKDGEFVHGEIYGPGIQKNYDYGVNEHQLIIYDVRVMNEDGTQKWLNPEECEEYARERGFDFVPVIYTGIFDSDYLLNFTVGPSILDPNTKVREGVVVKSRYKYDIEQNKQCLKSINPDYLSDSSNTDFH
jgi:RNA ligase (TIGR02306 family)